MNQNNPARMCDVVIKPRIARFSLIILKLLFNQISRTKMLAFFKLEKFDKNID